MPHDQYENPLITRYSSKEMSHLWSAQKKFGTWRRLWVALAEAQKELGLPVTDEQVSELKAHVDDIDFEAAAKYERDLRHDVMAHIHAYRDVCPSAGPIIHLGATSCYVTDNTDILVLRDALGMVCRRVAAVIDRLAEFAAEYRDAACLGFTHLQPAQPTTVGKRACLWAYDLVLDLHELEHRLSELKARSTKGTTGTQASFLKLFDGDHDKVKQLEQLVARKIGFDTTYAVTGQTYSRKIDSQVLDVLSGVAQSAHKMATDLRLLANKKEVEEPFGKKQIGSSAMAYKRNPMRSERICSLARYVISLQSSPANTLATQWMERTLDDSANRRLVLPQAFLAIDAVLILCQNVTSGLVVYPEVLAKNLREELPFMATENILMAAVAAGGDRQDLHERIRQHSHAAGAVVKNEGKPNDLIERLASDEAFAGVDFVAAMEPTQFVGRAPQQVDDFIEEVVTPIRQRYAQDERLEAEVNV
ncbi:MAG: adenylosuccinate lyase [Planctomycetes bacterium]|nr:adenylosuccinate lyase [Planctomycetota bacterium]MBL7039059.1 adenylosuccinate lyase [Pirellulaceae bacterium]